MGSKAAGEESQASQESEEVGWPLSCRPKKLRDSETIRQTDIHGKPMPKM